MTCRLDLRLGGWRLTPASPTQSEYSLDSLCKNRHDAITFAHTSTCNNFNNRIYSIFKLTKYIYFNRYIKSRINSKKKCYWIQNYKCKSPKSLPLIIFIVTAEESVRHITIFFLLQHYSHIHYILFKDIYFMHLIIVRGNSLKICNKKIFAAIYTCEMIKPNHTFLKNIPVYMYLYSNSQNNNFSYQQLNNNSSRNIHLTATCIVYRIYSSWNHNILINIHFFLDLCCLCHVTHTSTSSSSVSYRARVTRRLVATSSFSRWLLTFSCLLLFFCRALNRDPPSVSAYSRKWRYMVKVKVRKLAKGVIFLLYM